MAGLPDVDRAVPNTVKAYAHDLKDWFTFLVGHGLDWRGAQLENLGDFVAWLRLISSATIANRAELLDTRPWHANQELSVGFQPSPGVQVELQLARGDKQGPA